MAMLNNQRVDLIQGPWQWYFQLPHMVNWPQNDKSSAKSVTQPCLTRSPIPNLTQFRRTGRSLGRGTSRLIVRLIDSGDQYAVKPENLRIAWGCCPQWEIWWWFLWHKTCITIVGLVWLKKADRNKRHSSPHGHPHQICKGSYLWWSGKWTNL